MTNKALLKKVVPFILFLSILLTLPLQIYGTYPIYKIGDEKQYLD